jgi:hypothetical protein
VTESEAYWLSLSSISSYFLLRELHRAFIEVQTIFMNNLVCLASQNKILDKNCSQEPKKTLFVL